MGDNEIWDLKIETQTLRGKNVLSANKKHYEHIIKKLKKMDKELNGKKNSVVKAILKKLSKQRVLTQK